MQIPHHGFGLQGVEVRHTNIGNAGAGTGEGLQQLGATLGNINNKMADEHIRAAQAAREVKAARAVGERELAIDTLSSGIKIQMDEGTLSHEQAEAAYQKGLSELKAPEVEGVDPETKSRMDYQMDMLGKRGAVQLQPHIAAARQGAFRSDIDAVLDSQSKQAAFAGADVNSINARVDAMDEHGRLAYGEKWGAVKQNFIDRNWSSNITAKVAEAGDDLGKLKMLKSELGSDKYADKLDANNRLNLTAHLDGSISRIEQHNEMLAMKREMRAQNALQDIEKQNASGIPPTPEMMQEWESVAAGTSAAPHVGAMIKQGQQIQNFLRVPIDQQQATIQAMETDLMQNGGDASQQANVASMRRVFDANKKSLTENPLVYAQERLGAQVEPLDVAALASPEPPDQAYSAMKDRVETIKALQQKHGAEISLSPLLPQEVDALSSQLKSASPQQQTQILGNIKKSFADNDAYAAAMQQLSKDAPIQALAGTLSAKQKQIEISPPGWFSAGSSKQSRDVAATMLNGERVLKENKGAIAMPSDKDFLTSFDDYAGEAFAGFPEVKAASIDGAHAYYAGAVAAGVDPEQAQAEAFKTVVGGVTNHNGKKVIMPYGMREEDFTGHAQEAFASTLKDKGMPVTMADDFEDYDLQPVGDGEYLIKTGAEYLSDSSGEPLIINLNGRKP